jgi:hypothetical protein
VLFIHILTHVVLQFYWLSLQLKKTILTFTSMIKKDCTKKLSLTGTVKFTIEQAMKVLGGEESPRPGRFTPGKETWYPLNSRLGKPARQCGQVRKISPSTSFRTPNCPDRIESLYRLSYSFRHWQEIRGSTAAYENATALPVSKDTNSRHDGYDEDTNGAAISKIYTTNKRT